MQDFEQIQQAILNFERWFQAGQSDDIVISQWQNYADQLVELFHVHDPASPGLAMAYELQALTRIAAHHDQAARQYLDRAEAALPDGSRLVSDTAYHWTEEPVPAPHVPDEAVDQAAATGADAVAVDAAGLEEDADPEAASDTTALSLAEQRHERAHAAHEPKSRAIEPMPYRNPLAVLGLGFITFGIYDLYWLFVTRTALNQRVKKHPVPSLWLLFAPLLAMTVALMVTLTALAMRPGDATLTAINIVSASVSLLGVATTVVCSVIWCLRFGRATNEFTYGQLDQSTTFILTWVLAFFGIGFAGPAVIQHLLNKSHRYGATE